MTSELLTMQLLAMQRIWERTNAHLLRGRPGPCALRAAPRKSNRGRRPKPLFLPATGAGTIRMTDEPYIAVAFFLRRLSGMGWERAVAETAEEFGLGVKRRNGIVVSTRAAESRVERAKKDWQGVVVPYLIELFPDHSDRLHEFLRERRR